MLYAPSLISLNCFFHFLSKSIPLMKSALVTMLWMSVTFCSLQYNDPEAMSFLASPFDSVNPDWVNRSKTFVSHGILVDPVSEAKASISSLVNEEMVSIISAPPKSTLDIFSACATACLPKRTSTTRLASSFCP